MTMPFGATSSVLDYNRLPELICAFARKFLGIPLHHFFDDIWAFMLESRAGPAYRCALEIHEWFGVPLCDPLGDKPPKVQPPTLNLRLLGIIFDLFLEEIRNTIERITKLKREIAEIRDSGSLHPSKASKLRGKLGFTSSHFFGRVGRAAIRPLHRRQYMFDGANRRTYSLNPSILNSFAFFEKVLREPKSKAMFPVHSRHCVLYTDAEGNGGLGAVLFRAYCKAVGYATKASKSNMKFMELGGERTVLINPLETFAVLVALHTFKEQLRDTSITIYIDNNTAKSAISNGSSECQVSNQIAGEIWALAYENSMSIWVERVKSELNIADLPSRGCKDLPFPCAWKRATQVDLTNLTLF
jgi:hypothetical protein